METVDNKTVTCNHMIGVEVIYVRNTTGEAPVLFIHGLTTSAVLTLTNQTICVECPSCFRQLELYTHPYVRVVN